MYSRLPIYSVWLYPSSLQRETTHVSRQSTVGLFQSNVDWNAMLNVVINSVQYVLKNSLTFLTNFIEDFLTWKLYNTAMFNSTIALSFHNVALLLVFNPIFSAIVCQEEKHRHTLNLRTNLQKANKIHLRF